MKSQKTKFILVTSIMSLFILAFSLYLVSANTIGIQKENYKMTITQNINYGTDLSSVGMLSMENAPPVAPESYSNDSRGNFYLCDIINQRVLIFSNTGQHLSTVNLKRGIVASDIAVDNTGLMYIYDDVQEKLYQYNKDGSLINEVKVDITRWQSRGSMHIVDNNIYIESSDQQDILIAKISGDKLLPPTDEEILQSTKPGIHGISGKIYLVDLERKIQGKVEIMDKNGMIINTISLPIRGIVSIKFLCEDNKGNFFVQTEHLDNNEKVVLSIHKFDSNGNYLTTVPMTDTEYFCWTVKMVSIDNDGNIYQFVPAQRNARLNIFRKE